MPFDSMHRYRIALYLKIFLRIKNLLNHEGKFNVKMHIILPVNPQQMQMNLVKTLTKRASSTILMHLIIELNNKMLLQNQYHRIPDSDMWKHMARLNLSKILKMKTEISLTRGWDLSIVLQIKKIKNSIGG